jgi:hypothetical protein
MNVQPRAPVSSSFVRSPRSPRSPRPGVTVSTPISLHVPPLASSASRGRSPGRRRSPSPIKVPKRACVIWDRVFAAVVVVVVVEPFLRVPRSDFHCFCFRYLSKSQRAGPTSRRRRLGPCGFCSLKNAIAMHRSSRGSSRRCARGSRSTEK